ncbi:MAG TPA: zinc-binding dehydrogenase [Candidatus Eisenbergiella merdavium]|uniref:Zinc-binding dehydrogenase n=1 Tax=Candidatus Eisenbergiella merdavium TaxID=2838551 RepID=A0A9D2NJX0_9FIRM|nr:zinc-binding dehydrogenase [Candidatus Eisenbergiella merdavium]
MKSLVVDRSGALSFQELDMPEYNPCQALVKMRSCGVCNGTDTKIIHGTFKNFDSYPASLGHEGVGEVVAVGDKVTGLKIGDRVLLPFLEKENRGITPGWGAFSEYAVVGDPEAYVKNGMGPGTEAFSESYFAQTVLKDTDRVDDVGAAMIITFREVLSAIRRFGFEAGRNILIFGAGPVGLCFIRFCRLLGLKTIMAVDISDEKEAMAKKMGADLFWNSTREDVISLVRERFPQGLDYVVDAVGLNRLINQAMELIAYNGKICCYGISPKLSMELDWSRAPYNWSLQFVQWPSKKEEGEAHSQVMAWINCGALDPMDFISHVTPFEEIHTAFEKIERKDPDIRKMVVTFS